MADDALVERETSMIGAEVEDDVVLLDIKSGMFYQLNKVGGRVWLLLETPATVAALCARLRESFEVTPQACREATVEFLEQLREKGVVKITAPPA